MPPQAGFRFPLEKRVRAACQRGSAQEGLKKHYSEHMPLERALWYRALVLLLLAGSLDAEEAELLLPGQSRERPIAAGEVHKYRVEVMDAPLLVTVEQRGIDLVVSARGAEEEGPIEVDAPNHAWGPEVLLLRSPGERLLEIRAGQTAVPPGRCTIRVEELPASTAEGARRIAALEAMSRGSQLAAGTPEERRQALSVYGEALEGWRALGERRWQAEALQAIASLQEQAHDLRSAAAGYQGLLALWQELSDPSREALTQNRLGIIRQQSGEIEAARRAQDSALALWRARGERVEEAATRSEICLLEQTRGALQEALACHREVLGFFREIGPTRQEAQILHNLGGVYDLLGEPDAAMAHYEQALALRRKLGDRPGEAQTLKNMAVVHRISGEWQEALRLYGQVRDIWGSLGNRAEEASLLNNIGFTYNHLGEPQRALTFLEEALKLRREAGARRGELITLNNLGSTWLQLGDPEKARAHHRQALDRATALGDTWQEAVTRLRLVEVELERGDPALALRELDPALASLRKAGTRQLAAQALLLRGRALRLAGQPREALAVLREGLEARRSLRDRTGEAEALHALALVERDLDLRDAARSHAEEAVARVEELRNGFVSPDLRAAFLATQRRAYALVIDLSMDRHATNPAGGHDRTALQISEQARARSLLDALHSGNTVPAGSTVPAGLRERRKSLRHRLSARADQRLKQSDPKSEEAEALEREIETLLNELDGVEAEIRRQDPRYAALRQPQPLGPQEIAGLLDSGTLFLEYSLGEERSYLWAVGTGSFHSFVLPPQREIEELARRAYEEMSTVEAGQGHSGRAAEALGRILLKDVWSEAAGSGRLVIVPDGALHVLPFSALPVPVTGQGWDAPAARVPLLESHEVVYVPSATTLALQRRRLEQRPPAPKWAAVLADPVFSADDPRLKGRAHQPAAKPPLPAFERLPASRREAEEIVGLAPSGQVWTAFDQAANRETVLSADLRSFQVLHFATHAVADANNPELSGLLLSLVDEDGRPREGFLGLSDIYELDLGAGLVVLSGCRTAFGREVRGEGLMGITRAFEYAGVPRVVAGLWRVQDQTTAKLMGRFYLALWKDRLPPAAALRAAQRSLRRERRYLHPYSWAGFVLQGDWR